VFDDETYEQDGHLFICIGRDASTIQWNYQVIHP